MATPKLTLYLFPGACSIIPQILLHRAGLAYTPIGVPIAEVSTTFTKTNPKGQVPALQLDGEIITENAAIAHAINHLAPNAKVLGSNPMEVVRVCEWMSFLGGSFHAAVWGAYMRPARFTDDPAGEAGVKSQAVKKIRDRFALIESQLPAEGWAVGDGFTVVDAYLLPFWNWVGKRAGIPVETEYPKYAALIERVHGVDSVKEALAEEAQVASEMQK